MGMRHLLALLPLAVPFARAQTDNVFDVGARTPPVDPQCPWMGQLASLDFDSSGGLSHSEFHAFMSRINYPSYVTGYMESVESFDKLPWALRVAYKSLACHCQQLGFGESCCEGDDVEVLIPGAGNDAVDDGEMDSYRGMFCKLVSFTVEQSVPSPRPTPPPSAGPTQSLPPTESPSAGPTASPSLAPVTPGPTESTAIVAAPTVPPTGAPSEGGVRLELLSVPESSVDEDGVIGLAGIAGVAVAVPTLLLAVVALLVHRRKEEGRQLRKFAGEQAPEEDLEAPSTAADEDTHEPEPEPEAPPGPAHRGPGEDDESSAPSVWSEGEDEEGGALRDESMHNYDEAPGVGVGSSLAAIGVASTVAANCAKADPGAQVV